MREISLDLRERLVRARGTGTSKEVGERFEVPDSSVRRIWILHEKRGWVEPLKRGGRKKCKVDSQGEELIRLWIAETPDQTIIEVMARYLEARGIAVSEPAMRRTLKRLGFTRKKRRCLRPNAKAIKSSLRATITSPEG